MKEKKEEKNKLLLSIIFEKEFGSLRNATFLKIVEYERIKEWCINSGYLEFLFPFHQDCESPSKQIGRF